MWLPNEARGAIDYFQFDGMKVLHLEFRFITAYSALTSLQYFTSNIPFKLNCITHKQCPCGRRTVFLPRSPPLKTKDKAAIPNCIPEMVTHLKLLRWARRKFLRRPDPRPPNSRYESPVPHLLTSNSPPSVDERNLIHATLTRAREEELSLGVRLFRDYPEDDSSDPEFSQLEQLQSFIRVHEQLISPLRSLPPELLSLIFSFCIPHMEDLSKGWGKSPAFNIIQVWEMENHRTRHPISLDDAPQDRAEFKNSCCSRIPFEAEPPEEASVFGRNVAKIQRQTPLGGYPSRRRLPTGAAASY